MRTIAFFLGLCLFLLTGKGSVCSIVPHNHASHSSKYTEEKQQPGYTTTNTGNGIIKETRAKTERPDIICEDVEDEDTSNASARKYRSFTTGHFPLSYYFIADNCYDFCKDRSTFTGHLLNKYITQRVLRI